MSYKETIDYLYQQGIEVPEIVIVLGSGLSTFAELIEDKLIIPYSSIPGFVDSTVQGHEGNLIFGKISGANVVCQQGRFHYYEGWSMEQIIYPIRVFAKLGAKYYFATNAAGSLNSSMIPGQLVLLKDHINFMGANPLRGENKSEFGVRFPSMHNAYDSKLRSIALEVANSHDIDLKEGVYIAVSGPSFETKAECKMLADWGADVVGMSTVPEVIASVHSGLRVLCCSVVTNMTNIFHSEAHSHEDVQKAAELAKDNLQKLISQVIYRLNNVKKGI